MRYHDNESRDNTMTMMVTILEIDVPREIFRAVETVGREVLLIRDNKVIGEGYTSTMRDGVLAVQMRDDLAKVLVEDSKMVKLWAESFPDKKFKYSMFHFCSFTGNYLGENEEEYTLKNFDDVRIVDKSNLYYGMVPSTFKDVEGYRAVHKEYEAEEASKL
jgi:hypothetical protein